MSNSGVAEPAHLRVKLYLLNENRGWDDHGTGHVTARIDEKTTDGSPTGYVETTAESDAEKVLKSEDAKCPIDEQVPEPLNKSSSLVVHSEVDGRYFCRVIHLKLRIYIFFLVSFIFVSL